MAYPTDVNNSPCVFTIIYSISIYYFIMFTFWQSNIFVLIILNCVVSITQSHHLIFTIPGRTPSDRIPTIKASIWVGSSTPYWVLLMLTDRNITILSTQQVFTHILSLTFSFSLQNRLYTRTVIHIWVSSEVVFGHRSFCEILRIWTHHWEAVTTDRW